MLETLLLLISLSVCEYGIVAIMGALATHLSKLDSIQKMAERFSGCKFPSLHSRCEASVFYCMILVQYNNTHQCVYTSKNRGL